jgi:hypothetical protein
MTARKIPVKSIIYLVVGVAIAIFGLSQTLKTTANCGGQTMTAGQQCMEYSLDPNNNTTVNRSVDDQLHQNRVEGGIATGIGGLAILGAVVTFILWRRDQALTRG